MRCKLSDLGLFFQFCIVDFSRHPCIQNSPSLEHPGKSNLPGSCSNYQYLQVIPAILIQITSC